MSTKTRSNLFVCLVLFQYAGAVIVGLQGRLVSDPLDVGYFLSLLRGHFAKESYAVDLASNELWVGNVTATGDCRSGGQPHTGPRKVDDFHLGGIALRNQAFRKPIDSSYDTPRAYLEKDESVNRTGIFGLTPSLSGQPSLVDNLFANENGSHIVTIALERPAYQDGRYDGFLSLGEVLPKYTSILAQPRVKTRLIAPKSDQVHLQVTLGDRGVLGALGKEAAQPLTAMFTSRRLTSRVPKHLAESIYGSVPGAQLRYLPGIGDAWMVPCHVPIDISVDISGQLYPLHPLDASLDLSYLGYHKNDLTSDTLCMGTFLPDETMTEVADIEFGTTFLHNVYLLMDHGDSHSDKVFVQLLSTADPSLFLPEFNDARKSYYPSFHTSSEIRRRAPSEPSKPETNKPGYKGLKRHIGYAVVIGAVAGTLVLIALIAVSCHCVRKYRINKKTTSSKVRTRGPFTGGAYTRLGDPEPADRDSVVSAYIPSLPYAAETFTPPRAHRSPSGHFDMPYETTPWSPPRGKEMASPQK
ncbi:hypothetical protein ONZ45_g4524 [Pleurotus djamor]|nr:hypothetical protein ONZ45_g4524 [Pleurotus djamor]